MNYWVARLLCHSSRVHHDPEQDKAITEDEGIKWMIVSLHTQYTERSCKCNCLYNSVFCFHLEIWLLVQNTAIPVIPGHADIPGVKIPRNAQHTFMSLSTLLLCNSYDTGTHSTRYIVMIHALYALCMAFCCCHATLLVYIMHPAHLTLFLNDFCRKWFSHRLRLNAV